MRNLPVMLRPERVIDPYPVLDNFFYPGDSLPEIRDHLMKWLVAALTGKKKWKRDALVECIYNFMSLHTLVDALWVIHDRGDTMTVEQIAKRGDPLTGEISFSEFVREHIKETGRNIMEFYPDHLNPEEELTPFDIIHQLFAEQDLFEVRNKLSDWNSSAIACQYEYEPMKREDLIVFHRSLIRAIEAAFIIVEIRISNYMINDRWGHLPT